MGKSKGRKKVQEKPDDAKENLGPFFVKESPEIGRYLVAAKNVAKNEQILSEEPIIVGPCEDSKPLCIGCYVSLDTLQNLWSCKECGWPLCSSSCPGLEKLYGHSISECSILKQSKRLKDINSTILLKNMAAIAPLRCLVLKSSNEFLWNKLLTMESHNKTRMKNHPTLWASNEENIVNVIRENWGLSNFPKELIHSICGILEVNAFEVGTHGPNNLRAIYPNSFLFSHDCVPNTRHIESKDYKLTFFVTDRVSKNEKLTVTYTYILQGTLPRRKHLIKSKFFYCTCNRCSDATEFGTYTSALKCPLCNTGHVIPENPLNFDSNWKCNSKKCSGFIMLPTRIISVIEKLTQELDSIDGNDINGLEHFIEKHSGTLHENHYILLSAMYNLCQLYGKVQGYVINDLSPEQLTRKITICKLLLKILNKLDPGLTKTRGTVMYELQAPLFIQMQRSITSLSKKEVRKKLNEVCSLLEESKTIFSLESEGTEDHLKAQAAANALESLLSQNNCL